MKSRTWLDISVMALMLVMTSQAKSAAITTNKVFSEGQTYEMEEDLIFQNSTDSAFVFYRSKYQDIMNIRNKTEDPKRKVTINLYSGTSDYFGTSYFNDGKSVVIKKGTQWDVSYASPDTVMLETVRTEPKHSLMCRVQVLKKGIVAIHEVGDMSECAKALKLKLRKTNSMQNVYTIE